MSSECKWLMADGEIRSFDRGYVDVVSVVDSVPLVIATFHNREYADEYVNLLTQERNRRSANCNVIDNPDYYRLPCGRQLEDFIVWKRLDFVVGSALKYAWRAGNKFGESAEKDTYKMWHYIHLLERTRGNVYEGEVLPFSVSWRMVITELVEEAKSWNGQM